MLGVRGKKNTEIPLLKNLERITLEMSSHETRRHNTNYRRRICSIRLNTVFADQLARTMYVVFVCRVFSTRTLKTV